MSSNEVKDENAVSSGGDKGCDETVKNDRMDAGTKELTTKEAYFASLNAWVKHANMSQNAMALFPFYLLSSYPQLFQNPTAAGNGIGQDGGSAGPTQASAANETIRNRTDQGQGRPIGTGINAGNVPFTIILNEQVQAEIINRNGGFEHTIAPFWKRAVAEFIDVLLLLFIKVIITFIVMSVFDFDLGFDFDKEILKKTFQEDYVGFLNLSPEWMDLTSDLLALEIITKILVCVFEAICTCQGGATPGKMLMGLRIVYVEAMVPLQPPQPPQLDFRVQRTPLKALIYPAETPNFKRSFLRALTKNILMALLFPICFIIVFFKNNRTAYDIATKTLVIEDYPNATRRRDART